MLAQELVRPRWRGGRRHVRNVFRVAFFAATLSALPLQAGPGPAALDRGTAEARQTGRVAVPVVADAHVRADRPSANSGSSVRLTVDGSPTVVSYLRAHVRRLPGAVTRATLRVYSSRAHPRGFAVRAVADTSWREERITYATAPARGGRLGSSGPVAAGTWVTVDVTRHVTGLGRFSFALTGSADASLSLHSRESGSKAPQLVISTTAAPAVAAVGDMVCGPNNAYFGDGSGLDGNCQHEAVSDLLVDGGYAAFLALGDTQYEDGQLHNFRRIYDPSYGRVRSITRPVVGNHEYRDPGADGYFDYFGSAAGSRSRGYYSFDVGDWHLIALNSNCSKVGGCHATSAQARWLRADLAANPADCTLAYMHAPRFSSGRHGSTPYLAPLYEILYLADVDVLLSGHDHSYERFAPQDPGQRHDPARGIRQFVVGTGGKNLYGFETVERNSEARNDDTHGVLELTLGADAYSWRFVAGPGRGFSDDGSTRCH